MATCRPVPRSRAGPLPDGERERSVGRRRTTRTLRQALLSPRSVAIVGQSNDAAKTAGRPLKYLRQAGYAGTIYPINPRRETVLGERAWPSLAALPEVPDHAYIVTPTEGAVAAVAECGAIGVPVATILANGFAEAGEAGQGARGASSATSARAPASAWSVRRASAS